MSTLSLLKQELESMVDLGTDLGAGAYKALNAIRDYNEAKIISLEALKILCKRIQDEHFVSSLENMNEFETKVKRDELINQIIQEFDREIE